MKKIVLALSLCLFTTGLLAQYPPELRYQDNKTLTYDEVIAAYQYLAEVHPEALLMEAGITDCGRPLHVFVMGKGIGQEMSLQQMARNKTVLLINNGIHPGESAGIDASIAYSAALLEKGIPESVLVAVIPLYNIGGALNRGKFHRANQKGPLYHGFRGNARNLDLNRDFIKADALNTLSFYAIFHSLRPHIFVDTHTSNGADYQYTISLISTQKGKLNPVLAQYLDSEMEPYLYQTMAEKNWEMTPYVNVFGRVPDEGFSAFLETPRYASGYTALFNCLGFITETHMLKPYEDRVEATRSFLETITGFCSENADTLKRLKERAQAHDLKQQSFDLSWALDSSISENLEFKGYHYEYQQSDLGDYERLKYFEDQPRIIDLTYYPRYKATDSAKVPRYYVVPQAWRHVIQRLQYNQVKMRPISQDTVIPVELSYISAYRFTEGAYEGHHPLKELATRDSLLSQNYFAGDYLVPTDQQARRFIVAVLEPTATDSYLRWNFFDPIFRQKEYFSAYVFEDTAEDLLAARPELKRDFENWKEQHPQEARSAYRCLEFIYKRSPYYEENHLKYPVGRIF